MKIIETTNVNFSRGIVETIKQTDMFQQNLSQSALYINNLNPNKEHLTLLKRNSLIPDLIDIATLTTYTNRMILDPLFHTMVMNIVNPVQYRTFIHFLEHQLTITNQPVLATRIISDTAINGTVPTNAGLRVYSEPFVNNFTYPGWQVHGTWQDACRYGEAIMFVTRPARIDFGTYFPVYLWKNWTIKKKLDDNNQYWNGLFTYGLPQDEYFKVQMPSRVLEGQVGETYYNSFNDTWTSANTNIEVCWSESALTKSQLVPYFNISEIELDPLTPYNDNSIYTTDNFIHSYFVPDVPAYKTFCQNVLTTQRTNIQNENWFYNLNKNIYYKNPITDSTIIIDRGDYLTAVYNSGLNDTLIILHHSLLNYLAAQVPRPFIQSEQIPYCLVAVLEGNKKVVIYQNTYIVKTAYFRNCNVTIVDDTQSFYTDSEYNIFYYNNGKNYEIGYGHPKQWDHTHVAWSERIFASPIFNTQFLGSTVTFTIRFKQSFMNTLIDMNLISFELYVMENDPKVSLLKKVGLREPIDPPLVLYHKPYNPYQQDITDYSHYRLVKRFLIDGIGHSSQDNFKNKYYKYDTNSWTIGNDYIQAIPQNANGSSSFYRNLGNGTNVVNKDQMYTPDFMLWDYPTDAEPLVLSYSGIKWLGKGAGLIIVIKGLPLIFRCYDEYNQEEVAICRYPSIQNGSAVHDIFPKENKIQIGHLQHSAVVEFREQVLVFNRQGHYRFALPQVFLPETWEFLEVIDGTGTFSQKTICKTPYGIVYGSSSGIWITEGSIPQSLSDNPDALLAISGIYQYLMLGINTNYYNLLDLGNPGVITDYNTYIEFIYDDLNDELNIICPVWKQTFWDMVQPTPSSGLRLLRTTDLMLNGTILPNVPSNYNFNFEIRLIYNFPKKNWRIESYHTLVSNHQMITNTINTTPNTLFRTCNRYINGRSHVVNPNIITVTRNLLTNSYVIHYQTLSNNPTALVDIYLNELSNAVITELITHELGNDIDDSMLHRIILNAKTDNNTYNYTITQDFKFSYNLRNRNWFAQGGTDAPIDLVTLNMTAKGGLNPFTNLNQTWDRNSATESIILLTPMNTKYRHMRFEYVSEVIKQLNAIQIQSSIFKRKTI